MMSALLAHLGRRDFIQVVLLFVVIALFWFFPRLLDGVFSRLEKAGTRLARKKRAAILSIAVSVIVIRLLALPFLPVSFPQVHDEFSYLLAGDTFAHGRLANPPHPMWIFFDTFHVNQHPTYMSKYPPAQGMVLALGQWLGHPWIGVLLSMTVMCSVALWMLQAWMPPRWALLGAVLILFRFGLFSYWMNSYWGGAIPAIGGALVLGAASRLVHFSKGRDALLLGLGAGLLENSRPLEGLLLCVPVIAYLLIWLRKTEKTVRLRVLFSFCAAIIPCTLFVGYYNWRGTGSPAMFPYSVNEQTYFSTPTLFWEKLRPPLHYSNPQFEAFYNGWERSEWLQGHVNSPAQAVRHIGLSVVKVSYFFLWPELCLPLLLFTWILRDHKTRFLIIVTAVSFLGFLLVPWTQAHYAAPLTGALFSLVVQGIRHLRQWKYGGRPVGVSLSRGIVFASVLLAPVHPHSQAIGNLPRTGIAYRAEFERELLSLSGKHLVIVRYSPDHPVLQEWVYNRANIDGARIVWAREIPGTDLNPLLNYFHDRKVWVVEPDLAVPRLSAYSQSQP